MGQHAIEVSICDRRISNVIGSAKTCMIEKKSFYKTKPKSDMGQANKKIRKVENSYLLLSFLSLSLNMKPITAACSRVARRKTIVPFSAALRLDSQLRKAV